MVVQAGNGSTGGSGVEGGALPRTQGLRELIGHLQILTSEGVLDSSCPVIGFENKKLRKCTWSVGFCQSKPKSRHLCCVGGGVRRNKVG